MQSAVISLTAESLIQLNNLMLQRLGHCFGTTVDMQLVIDVLQMFFDGVEADRRFISNHLVGIASHEMLQDHRFTRSQIE